MPDTLSFSYFPLFVTEVVAIFTFIGLVGLYICIDDSHQTFVRSVSWDKDKVISPIGLRRSVAKEYRAGRCA